MYSLVNNAGIATDTRNPTRVHETDEHAWDTMLRVNTTSVFLGCKYGIAQMLKQEPHSSGDRGWVINLAAIWGLVGGLGSRLVIPGECALVSGCGLAWVYGGGLCVGRSATRG